MTPLRIIFICLSCLAIAATFYIVRTGHSGQSRDITVSIRPASGGYGNASVK